MDTKERMKKINKINKINKIKFSYCIELRIFMI